MKKRRVRNEALSIRAAASLGYLLYLPDDYSPRKKGGYPLILFLHGAGERGHDLNSVKVHGVVRRIEDGDEFPFIVVAPQCPPSQSWDPYALNALLDMVMKAHNVDEDRVYVTGLSMGGLGTWALANHAPHRFAAIAPICPPFIWFAADRLKHVPVWCFHGAMDPVVPIEDSIRVVRNLRNAGANVRFTVYPDADHDAWTTTYSTPPLYEWFLSCRRAQVERRSVLSKSVSR